MISITKEGLTKGNLLVKLTFDERNSHSTHQLRDKDSGKLLAVGGVTGANARRFFNRLNKFYFGDETQV